MSDTSKAIFMAILGLVIGGVIIFGILKYTFRSEDRPKEISGVSFIGYVRAPSESGYDGFDLYTVERDNKKCMVVRAYQSISISCEPDKK